MLSGCVCVCVCRFVYIVWSERVSGWVAVEWLGECSRVEWAERWSLWQKWCSKRIAAWRAIPGTVHTQYATLHIKTWQEWGSNPRPYGPRPKRGALDHSAILPTTSRQINWLDITRFLLCLVSYNMTFQMSCRQSNKSDVGCSNERDEWAAFESGE